MIKIRGKKTDPETIYAIMAVWALTENFSETSRILGIPVNTVEGIVKSHKNDDEFVKLRKDTKGKFVDRTTQLIDKLLDRMEDTVDNNEFAIPLNQLSSALGMLYEKRALALGEATENTKVTFELPEEVKDFAG